MTTLIGFELLTASTNFKLGSEKIKKAFASANLWN